MKKQLREIIYWAALLSTCTLTVVSTVLFLWMLDVDQPIAAKDTDTTIVANEVSAEHDKLQQLFEKVGGNGEFSRVLLPLGPDEGRLPGSAWLWSEFQKGNPVAGERTIKDGFDGLQGVDNVIDFSRGAVSELFLTQKPRQVFRRGRFLYLLNDNQQILIIDCLNPDQPSLSGHLPYSLVKHMAMQGNIAYLLIERSGVSAGRMLLVDLKSPDKPRRIAQFDLPEDAFSFFFVDSQLLVYTASQGYKSKNRIYVYDVNDSVQLQLLGHIESPNFGLNFLQFDQYVLVPGAHEGLTLYDFSDPFTPVQVAALDSPHINRMARYGDFVFAAGSDGRIVSIDFSDPFQPALASSAEEVKHLSYLLAYDEYTYYFTFNGYLKVFNFPLGTSRKHPPPSLVSDDPLASLHPGTGFTLLGTAPAALPAGVTASLPLAEGAAIVDQLIWQDCLVVLDAEGILHFYDLGADLSLSFRQELKLLTPRRWLASGRGRLYVGGGKDLDIISQNLEGVFSVATEMELSVNETWDGLVIRNVLLLAAGKQGLLTFSLQRPDAPALTSVWGPPRHLVSQFDVRHLAAVDDGRVLFSAGAAGVSIGRVDDDKKFTQQGSFRFSSPVNAVAVYDGIGLVATGEEVSFIDVRDAHSLQNLGKITFPEVERLAVAAPDLWAGYVDAVGWSIFPLPRFLSPEDVASSRDEHIVSQFNLEPFRYRLHLFSKDEVRIVPGVLSLPVRLTEQIKGGRPHVN